VWQHSGRAAAGLDVVFLRAGATSVHKSGADGIVMAPAFDLAHVVDAAHEYSVDLPASRARAGVLRVPEPVRVRGRVRGEAPARIRVGAGRRQAVMERHRGAERLGNFAPAAGENTIFGIELPRVAVAWRDLHLDDGGAFESEALSSEDAVQLLAFDRDGGLTAKNIAIPADVKPGQVLDAGTLRIAAPRAVDFDLEVPQELDIVVRAVLQKPVVRSEQRAEIGRHLSVLDQFDEDTFEFATGRGPYQLDLHRTTRIGGLPPYGSIDVRVLGTLPGMSVRRTIKLAASGVTHVHLSASDLGIAAGARMPAPAVRDVRRLAPAPRGRLLTDASCGDKATTSDQYPACQGEIQIGLTTWETRRVESCSYNASTQLLTAVVSEPGTWKFLYSDTPFLVGFSVPGAFTSPTLEASVALNTVQTPVDLFVTFYKPNSFSPVTNLPFQISSLLLDPDSFEGTTPASDTLTTKINCVNASPLNFYVRDEDNSYIYWYDGEPIIFGNTAVITLNRTPKLFANSVAAGAAGEGRTGDGRSSH
jgi:hypothetical protein